VALVSLPFEFFFYLAKERADYFLPVLGRSTLPLFLHLGIGSKKNGRPFSGAPVNNSLLHQTISRIYTLAGINPLNN